MDLVLLASLGILCIYGFLIRDICILSTFYLSPKSTFCWFSVPVVLPNLASGRLSISHAIPFIQTLYLSLYIISFLFLPH